MAPEGSITKADEHSRLEFAGRWAGNVGLGQQRLRT
jgi:hypothetical protein